MARLVKQTWVACQHKAGAQYNWQPECINACPFTCIAFGVQISLLKASLHQTVNGLNVCKVLLNKQLTTLQGRRAAREGSLKAVKGGPARACCGG